MALDVRPIPLREARRYIAEHHRHSNPPRGWLFGCALWDGDTLRGVGVASRPVARHAQDGRTVEITRVCTDGVYNGCSRIYGALCRAAAALGYRKAVTYTLEHEAGASPKAAGFTSTGAVQRGEWPRPSLPGRQGYVSDLFGNPTTPEGTRLRWERSL